jgi:hypothetical protein
MDKEDVNMEDDKESIDTNKQQQQQPLIDNTSL